jgi:4-azaleucine resistance transporter AzlC
MYKKLMLLNKKDFDTFKFAFITTIPVMLGYIAIGLAFGLMLINAGYHWMLAPVMCMLIYAGAAQFMAVGLFIRNASFLEIAAIIFFVNARHMVYGLSLIRKFKDAGIFKPYLVFSLTDETYALLTTVKEKEDIDKNKFYFYVGILDQCYWIIGSTFGAIAGKIFSFNTKGIDFALTALFVVLLIEQIRSHKNRIPFVIATACSIAALIITGSGNMLIVSIVSSIVILVIFRKKLKNES